MKKLNSHVMTLNEFSAEVGVSTATVSAVFNNKHKERRISEKTVELVRRQAKRLGYHPNVAARRLRIQRDMKVCQVAVITSYETPFHVSSNLVRAIEATASKYYSNITAFVEIIMFHRDKISDLPGVIDGSRFNAAVITNTSFEDDLFFKDNKVSYPVVFIGRDIEGYSCVRDDDYSIGELAATELIVNCRCKNVAIVTPDDNLLTQATKRRCEGFWERCANDGISAYVLKSQAINESSAADVVSRALKSNKIDGLYCVSDILAMGAYYAINQEKLSVPKDVAVIGIGDVSWGEFMNPPLTTFSTLNSKMKDDYAAKMLFEQLYEKKTEGVSRIFHTGIVRRNSTMRF